MMWRLVLIYLGLGWCSGKIMQDAIPEMTNVAVAYYAVSWPEHVFCGYTPVRCGPLEDRVPDWMLRQMFDFDY